MINLQPIGPVDKSIMDFLKYRLSSIWAVAEKETVDIPRNALDEDRRQFEGVKLLGAIPDSKEGTLGIIDEDVYTNGLNFIFGLASGKKALISLKRLKPEFYGKPEDEELFKIRALKEAMHELGHVFGLKHCPDRRCVMHFSNSIEDTDYKDWRYCGWCGGLPPELNEASA